MFALNKPLETTLNTPSPEHTWQEGAFAAPYIAFNAKLLSFNDDLCAELLTACHVIGIPRAEDEGGEAQGGRAPLEGALPATDNPQGPGELAAPEIDTSTYVTAAGDTFALDRPCLVCRTIELYRQKYGLSAQWVIDYAFLCAKCLSAPVCAVSIFISAFEFVYIMDLHFLPSKNVTLVGSFARFALTINDIHRHFFLHCCFRTDGGIPNRPTHKRKQEDRPTQPDKVQYSNYSFLAQLSTRALLSTLSNRGDENPNTNPHRALATALMNWKDCARKLDCTEGRRSTVENCCTRALAQNSDFEKTANVREEGDTWEYADMILLLLAETPAIWEPSPPIQTAARTRHEAVTRSWTTHQPARDRDIAPRFNQINVSGAEPDLELGPLMGTVLKHGRSRGSTGGECLLCNLMVVRPYWVALRRLKTNILWYSDNNTGLFDCIVPVINQIPLNEDLWPADGGRFITLLRAAGPEAIFKHMFCDPMCAINDLEVNPWLLYGHPPHHLEEELSLFKAKLACGNTFEGRVCTALRALVYTFKTYQVFIPRPTTLATFVREAGALLKRHAISLLSLEHTLSTYV
ncbi:DNA packaging protein [Macropodid alphaherpesvirus 2]|uniref:Packaging protein UL32 n=1 Tax=Macropodid alphaherpesvirus 2 TaxID=83440 RepID=A0AAE7SXU5_9ALPH|nr:DNA packaging protein [Macropodid alphaherpesvirus 2]QOD40210.1 DNA packaging protein [Macropodid alphaherpesvirus 2]WGO49732.1 DNA packaging protein [Macropodid alphaherpesvirus 2]